MISDLNTVELVRREGLKWHMVYVCSYYRRIKYRATLCGMAMYATETETVNENDVSGMDDVCKTCKRVLKAELRSKQ